MAFVVDPKTLSFSKAIQETKAFIDLKPDALKWTDFFDSSAGQTIIELLSGLKIYDAHQTIVGRRETYLSYAINLSSNIAIAQTLGYSVNKGTNSHMTISITPNITAVMPKYSIIGVVKDQDLMLLNQETFNNGVPMTVDIVLGTLKTQNITIPSSDVQVFRFTDPNISEDFRLLLNSVEVPKSNIILDLTNDKYVSLTNTLTSIDVIYQNDAVNPVPTNPYVASDTLTVEYIELGNLVFDELNDLTFLFGSIILASTIILNPFRPSETTTSIKTNAPLFHETQSVIKGREDFKKIFKQLDSSLADTNGHDLSPAVIELTYVKNDLTLLTTIEKTNFSNQLAGFTPFGIPLPIGINDPTQITLSTNIVITLSDSTTNLSTATTDVANIIKDYEKILGQTIKISDIEEKINELDYVKISRINILSFSFPNWQATTSYAVGNNITSTNISDLFYYKALIKGLSSASEPTFPTTHGGVVDEGTSIPQLRWQAVLKTNDEHTLDWDEFFIFSNNISLV